METSSGVGHLALAPSGRIAVFSTVLPAPNGPSEQEPSLRRTPSSGRYQQAPDRPVQAGRTADTDHRAAGSIRHRAGPDPPALPPPTPHPPTSPLLLTGRPPP